MSVRRPYIFRGRAEISVYQNQTFLAAESRSWAVSSELIIGIGPQRLPFTFWTALYTSTSLTTWSWRAPRPYCTSLPAGDLGRRHPSSTCPLQQAPYTAPSPDPVPFSICRKCAPMKKERRTFAATSFLVSLSHANLCTEWAWITALWRSPAWSVTQNNFLTCQSSEIEPTGSLLSILATRKTQ